MRVAQLMLPILAVVLAAGCARQQPTYYVMDPQTGQPVPVVQQYSGPQQYVQAQAQQPQYAPPPQYAQSGARGFFNSAQPSYAPQYEAPAQPQYAPPPPSGRGLFNSRAAQPQYAPPNQSYVLQYQPPAAQPAPYAAAPYAYGYAQPSYQTGYTLDAGDKLRISVFGQEGISGSYMVDAGGNVNLPLAGVVPARGFTTEQLARMIGERLKQGYVREPHVTVSIDSYRPFFIMGEVTTPGQYAYVPNMTVENAVAIAGGFAPRAQKQTVELTRNGGPQRFTGQVPLNYPLQPGDTIVVKERWF